MQRFHYNKSASFWDNENVAKRCISGSCAELRGA